jgi:hypothetical protein
MELADTRREWRLGFFSSWFLATTIHLLVNGLFLLAAVGHIMTAFTNPHFVKNPPPETFYDFWNCGFLAAKNLYERFYPDPAPAIGVTFHGTPQLLAAIARHEAIVRVLFFIWSILFGLIVAAIVGTIVRFAAARQKSEL